MELSFLLFQKVLSMALMVLIGFVLVKAKLLQSRQSTVISTLNLYVVAPCLFLSSLQQEFSAEKLNGLLVAFAVVIVSYAIFLVLTHFVGKGLHLDKVEQASLLYSNGGNLIVPLVMSLLGREYVLYSIAFICVQVVLLWTHLVRLIRPENSVNLKKILLNPNIISIALGLVLFFLRIELPAVLGDTVSSVGDMTGPLAMIMLGMLMADVDLKAAFLRPRHYLICFGRLIVVPLLFILMLWASGITRRMPEMGQVLIVTTLAVAAPVAVNVVQMSNLFGTAEEAKKASAINVMTVFFCIVTMPLMTMIYQWLC